MACLGKCTIELNSPKIKLVNDISSQRKLILYSVLKLLNGSECWP